MGRFLDDNNVTYKGKFLDDEIETDNNKIVIEENGEEMPFFLSSEQQRTTWMSKGPIGIGEAWNRQNKLDLIPFSPSELIRSGSILSTVKKLQKDEYDNPSEKEKDIEAFKSFMFKIEEEQIRGFSMGGNIFRGAIQIPGFASELAISLGLVSAAKKTTLKALGITAKKIAVESTDVIAKKTAGQFLKKAAKGAVEAIPLTAATTPIMYNRYLAKSNENQIFANLALTDKGVTILKESNEIPIQSFVRGYADTFIEVYSEMLGEKVFGHIGTAAKRSISSRIPKETRNAIFNFMNKVTPKGRIVDIVKSLKSAGKIEGVPSEILEEIVGDQLRAVFGIQDFGEKGGNAFDNMRDAIPSFDEIAVMAGIFSIPGATSYSGQILYNKLIKRGISNEDAKNAIDNSSQSEKENILNDYISKIREKAKIAIDKSYKGKELTEEEKYALNDMFDDYIDKGWISPSEKILNDVEKSKAINNVNEALKEAEDGYKKDIKGISSKEQIGETIEQVEPIEEPSGEKIKTGGVFQEQEKITRKRKYEIIKERIAEIKQTKKNLEEIKDIEKETLQYFKDEKKKYKNSVKRYEGGRLDEEYNELPNYYKSKQGGMTLDALASEAGFENDMEFRDYLIDINDQIEKSNKRISDINESIDEETQKKIVKTEINNLKQRLTDFKAGKLEGIKEINDLRKDLIKRIKKDLPQGQRGKMISTINSIKNEKTLNDAYDKLDKILQDFNERQRRARALKQAMRNYKHPENIIDAKYQEKINDIRESFGIKKGDQKKSLKELSTDDLIDLANKINDLIIKGKVSYKNKEINKAMAREIMRGVLIKSAGGDITIEGIGSLHTKKMAEKKEFDGFTRPWNALNKIFGKLGEELFYKQFDNLNVFEGMNKQIRIRKIEEARKKYKISLFNLGKFEQIGRFSFSRNNLMSIYAQRNNKHGREAMIYGNNLSEEEYNNIIKYIEKELPNYAKLTNDISNIVSENFKTLKENLLEVNNLILKKVDNYFPIYRMNLSREAYDSLIDIDILSDFASRDSKGFDYTKVSDGFKIERKDIHEHNQMPISLDFYGNALKAINTQEHYLAFADMQKMINSVMSDKILQKVIEYRHGTYAKEWLNDYLKNSINPTTVYSSLNHSNINANKYMNMIKRGLYIKYLGYNVKSAAKAIPSLYLVLPNTSLPQLHASMFKVALNKEYRNEIRKLDPSISLMLQERDLNTYMYNIQKLSNKDIVRAFDLALHSVGANSMKALINMDQYARLTAFDAVYKSNLKKIGHEAAIKKAHETLLKTQPQARIIDLPSLYRTGNEWVDLVLFCSNQLNQINNIIRYDMPGYLKEGEYGKAISQIAGIMISSFLIYAITNPGKFPPDDSLEAIEAMFGSAISSVPIIGRFALSTGLFIGGDKQAYYKSSSISSAESLLAESIRGIMKIASDDKKIEGIADITSMILLLNGRAIPYNQIKTTIKGLYDYANGDAENFLRLIYSEYQLEEK